MKTKRVLLISLCTVILCLSLSCSPKTSIQESPAVPDNKYDTAFPTTEAAVELEDLIDSVRMINCVAYYKHFIFPATSRIKRAELDEAVIREQGTQTEYFNETASGTATLMAYQGGKLTLLTSAHIVNFPDTLVFYQEEEQKGPDGLVQSIAVKERQSNYIPDLEGADDLRIIAMDASLDIAIMGQRVPFSYENRPPVFSYPLGHAQDLQWGSFVYVVGFPGGAKMLSRGIVSKPFRDRRGSFIIDAPFNRGFSGGVVLAVRDGIPHFELVGLAVSSASTIEYYLSPTKDDVLDDYDPRVPYPGDAFVRRKHNLRYGITICVSIDAIRDFVQQNKRQLARQGYNLGPFG